MLARTRSLIVFLAVLGMAAAPALAQGSAGKVAQLVKASPYDFTQKTDTVWSADFKGKSLSAFRLVVAVQDDVMVTFVTVAEKPRIPLSVDFMHKLLRFNSTLDRVKIGLDDDGDLFVRCDASVRILDAKELAAIVDQVSAAADEVYKGVATALISE